ncbi:glycosyltransferase family 9 protein [Chitinibacteraceae bacterium HSL-7]
MSRAAGRLLIFSRALPRLLARLPLRLLGLRRRPEQVKRVLVAHHLLLGDTLMLTPLLAQLRQRYPAAEIVMTCPVAVAPLYATHPYGVTVLPFAPKRADTVRAIVQSGPYDLALVPGDTRHAWLALAAGSRWIVAHDGDKPAWKDWPVDEALAYPDVPTAWGDIAAQLAGADGSLRYRAADWQAPPCTPFEAPSGRYAVLHLGASTPLKHWPSERWLALADWLAAQGVTPVWSGGPGESALVAEVDPDCRFRSYAGALDLPQMWQLLAGAEVLVCPDTGVAHLGRVVGTPTVTLFGPGNGLISGAGQFWAQSPYLALTEEIPCRDQQILFRRERVWIRRCGRGTSECAQARCMEAISFDAVQRAYEALSKETRCD